MPENASIATVGTSDTITLRGKEYPIYTDFSDDDFIAFARFRMIKASQASESGAALGVDPSLKDEGATFLKLLLLPDLPNEMVDLARPTGFKIRLTYKELTLIFVRCLEVLKERDPEQWDRLKDQEIDPIVIDPILDGKDREIAELKAQLAAQKDK